MSVKVIIPTPLRPSVNQQSELFVDNVTTVGALINNLIEMYPKLNVYLCNENGDLRKFVNFYVNDKDIRDLDHANTLLNADDVLSIVPSIAGGVL